MLFRSRGVRDLRAVLEEIVPALGYLEDAIQREREALERIAEEAETQECFCCGEPTRCEPGVCEQCAAELDEILRVYYWEPRAKGRRDLPLL